MSDFNVINTSGVSKNEFSLTVISGKGGTGKTTITASLAYLVDKEIVKADCDVDASNLGIILEGETLEQSKYIGAKVALINQAMCDQCGGCKDVCRYDAVDIKDSKYIVNNLKCEGCNACVVNCHLDAIKLIEEVTGDVIKKDTKAGKLVTSKMIPGAEGSGKLVTEVRRVGKTENSETLIDGSPGIGCAVMASVTGSNHSLIVTEPTQSGFEDMKRVYEIVANFDSIPLAVINKYDINEEVAIKIEKECERLGIKIVGKIPFDTTVNEAVNNLKPIIEYKDSKAAIAINEMYKNILNVIKGEN
ncbi:(4Fe-4S)-binding protein [Clostridiaceae bacterium HSG29]|nr:(4Fe-4S)-binding protein [Clostridiaceae bacterium HSG29]